jgi:hypothetical protein
LHVACWAETLRVTDRGAAPWCRYFRFQTQISDFRLKRRCKKISRQPSVSPLQCRIYLANRQVEGVDVLTATTAIKIRPILQLKDPLKLSNTTYTLYVQYVHHLSWTTHTLIYHTFLTQQINGYSLFLLNAEC